jgi:hypothetical protein
MIKRKKISDKIIEEINNDFVEFLMKWIKKGYPAFSNCGDDERSIVGCLFDYSHHVTGNWIHKLHIVEKEIYKEQAKEWNDFFKEYERKMKEDILKLIDERDKK